MQPIHSLPQRRRRPGMALVEFALVLPVLLAVVLGIIEFGFLEKDILAVANAAREGVRYAAVGNTTANVRQRVKNAAATLNPELTDAQIVLEQTSDVASATPSYTAWPADTTATTPRNGVTAGNLIRVSVTYTHKSLTGFFPFLNDRQLSTKVAMAREATG